jgi:hypothetical protein
MAFINNSITTTSCSGTSVTGSTIYSGSSEWSTIRISQNRKLLYSSRTPTILLSGTGVILETILTSITVPPNTLKSGDTLEIYALYIQSASGATGSSGRIRVGISADTSTTNSPLFTNSTLLGFNVGATLSYSKILFTDNSTGVGVNNTITPYANGGTFTIGSLFNLSGANTYITFSTARGNLSSTITLRDYDIFLNR